MSSCPGVCRTASTIMGSPWSSRTMYRLVLTGIMGAKVVFTSVSICTVSRSALALNVSVIWIFLFALMSVLGSSMFSATRAAS